MRPDSQASSQTRKSLWEEAKRAASVGVPVASKAISLGKLGASGTAGVGKKTYTAAKDATRDVLKAGAQAYAGSKLESAVQAIDNELDQRGAKLAAKQTTQAIVGRLDQVTGKRLVELLEQKLKLQDTYNDVLATRLAEALERISKLEVEVSELRSRAADVSDHEN
jgi:hypothetical protein